MTISILKEQLGSGMGLRKNKYLLEVPGPGIDSNKMNILCKSAGLPEKTINVTQMWHKGRKYNLRSETDYGGTYEITVLDDSDMTIRKGIDAWLEMVDNSELGGTSNAPGEYQVDINIWQLDATGAKVYGYTIQNAYPSSMGTVTYDDSEENTLVEFNVTFTFSEFIPLSGGGGGSTPESNTGVESLFD